MYLNNRRGVSVGNTVRGLSEMDYINNIQGDSDKVARAASAYQLYENNGVLKRDQVADFLKNLGQNERKTLRDLGVKFGRYHIFLHKLISPL